MTTMYTLLGLSSHKGVCSRWIDGGRERWEKYLSKLLGQEVHCGSTHGNLSDKKRQETPGWNRCLPALCFATVGHGAKHPSLGPSSPPLRAPLEAATSSLVI